MNKLINKLNSQKGKAGFTIIEVLIVLAIGALIILAVLLAVPALQRNQRNSAIKSDASKIAAEIANLNSDQAAITAANINNRVTLNGANTLSAVINGAATYAPARGNLTVYTGTAGCPAVGVNTITAGNVTIVMYTSETGGATPDSRCIRVD